MVFKLALTFGKPTQGGNAQRGFPAPGTGDQTVGEFSPAPAAPAWAPVRPTQGRRSFWRPATPAAEQRGFPVPQNPGQRRPAGSMDNRSYVNSGLPVPVVTPYFSRGAAATVQNYGKVFTNPIGAGVVARYRPQASYGKAAQYANGVIFFSNQAIPTSVNLQGLTDPAALQAVLGDINVQAAYRTTG